MLTLILPDRTPTTSLRDRNTYCSILTHLLRATTDAEEALELFSSLLLERGNPGFASFDAHVGDTACHLRANMLRDVFVHLKGTMSRNSNSEVPHWITMAKSHLNILSVNAAALCSQLIQHRVDPRRLGLGGKGDTVERIVQIISTQNINRKLCPGNQDAEYSREQCLIGCTATYPEVTWDLTNPTIVIRFIVYSYTLSKYKRFIMTEQGLGCRLWPQLACREGARLIKPSWNPGNCEYKEARTTPICAEFAALQVWMSRLSCAWLHNLSYSSFEGSTQAMLVLNSIKSSIKGIVASACFPTYLLLRAYWCEAKVPVILLDRHFCSKGFHYHVITCTLQSYSESYDATRIMPIKWKITEITLQDEEDDDTTPYIIVMGNSLNGSHSSYVNRLLFTTADERPRVHKDDNCIEDVKHVSELLSTDFDRLSLATFAAHRSYGFTTNDVETEAKVRQSLFDSVRGDHDSRQFQEAWDNHSSHIDEIGAGMQNLRNFRWQHVLTETKFGLRKLLDLWIQSESPMPLVE